MSNLANLWTGSPSAPKTNGFCCSHFADPLAATHKPAPGPRRFSTDLRQGLASQRADLACSPPTLPFPVRGDGESGTNRYALVSGSETPWFRVCLRILSERSRV
ncbi:hypothetical protein N7510_010631 [Penicillium lagena]|uniref:uncharacterized protein n=1 Tax=Penicillium lagena TaxID=94218 RepID=UPI0025418284|nr:uncharacterized protein N7510_010631 [Penicillium lagena]KAJ5601097.1 hypothetical protein N7510_010631 [Penicillium lagena]